MFLTEAVLSTARGKNIQSKNINKKRKRRGKLRFLSIEIIKKLFLRCKTIRKNIGRVKIGEQIGCF